MKPRSTLVLLSIPLVFAMIAHVGALDPTFGIGGIARAPVAGTYSSVHDAVERMARTTRQ